MTESQLFRADKALVLKLVAKFAPEYLDVLNTCRNPAAWGRFNEKLHEVCTRHGVQNYVRLYENEAMIQSALQLGLMSKDELGTWRDELNAQSPSEQQEAFRRYAQEDNAFTERAEKLMTSDEEALDPEARERQKYLFGFFLAWFHDALAVMVHGEKMTSLVPKALAGHEDSYLKAVHIDKRLLYEHPGMRAIHEHASGEGNRPFLEKAARHLAKPVTQGRIQLSGLFVVFALLESLGWLDGLRHREILDICDEAGLDRWQNRIEEETCVTKALLKYRRYQKTGGLSMH